MAWNVSWGEVASKNVVGLSRGREGHWDSLPVRVGVVTSLSDIVESVRIWEFYVRRDPARRDFDMRNQTSGQLVLSFAKFTPTGQLKSS